MAFVRALGALLVGLAILGLAAQLALRPDPRDALRPADQLLLAGHTRTALRDYQRMRQSSPTFAPNLVRLALAHTLRGEAPAAQAAYAAALGQQIGGEEYHLVRLGQGALAAANPGYGDPDALWALIAPSSSLYPQSQILRGDSAIIAGRYPEAEASYRAALAERLPPAWARLAHTRLALLRASSDPQAAREELRLATSATPLSPASLADLLLPAIGDLPTQLDQILLTPDAETRAQLLAQTYLELRLYALAEAQLETIRPGGPLGVTAAAYRAYTRWLSGDRAGGIERLNTLVADHPNEPRARALLAVAALAASDPEEARAQLTVIRQVAPGEPATHLAWGQWYASQGDYLAAAESYRRALDRAAPSERGTYALFLARFHLGATLAVCEAGLPAAQTAALSEGSGAAAWSTLSQARLACGDRAGARLAAERAAAIDPRSPEAHYRLGQALAALGDQPAAAQALASAADLNPAGPWQARAESLLSEIGR